MKKVYCKDCAFRYIIQAGGETHPMCLATARFESGPVRDDVDMVGVVSAIRRNLENDCEYHSRIGNLRLRRIKKWISEERLGGDGKERQLGEYPREEERRQLKEQERELYGGEDEESDYSDGEESIGEGDEDYEDDES